MPAARRRAGIFENLLNIAAMRFAGAEQGRR